MRCVRIWTYFTCKHNHKLAEFLNQKDEHSMYIIMYFGNLWSLACQLMSSRKRKESELVMSVSSPFNEDNIGFCYGNATEIKCPYTWESVMYMYIVKIKMILLSPEYSIIIIFIRRTNKNNNRSNPWFHTHKYIRMCACAYSTYWACARLEANVFGVCEF